MKRLSCTIVFLLIIIVVNGNHKLSRKPLYRGVGYKGNVSFTNQLVFFGLDSSHGYMFSEYHYLGLGAGFFMSSLTGIPMFSRVFVDYKAYCLKSNRTLTAGVQLGCCKALKLLSNNTFQSAVELYPRIGWNRAFNKKMAFDLTLGTAIFGYRKGCVLFTQPMPKISIGLEF